MPLHNQYSQDYDKILKENAEAMILPLAQKLFHLEIIGFESIPDNLQRTIEREPDFLKIVVNEQRQRCYILHLEFQVANEPKMLYRMLEYAAFLTRKYELPIKQYVFYIGQETPTMRSKYSSLDLAFRFNLLNIQNIPYEQFLESSEPEEVILSILANFGSNLPEQIIQQILYKLKGLVTEKILLERYFTQLEILSKLRNLQPQTIKQVNIMPLVYDLKTDLRYLQGVEDAQKTSAEMLQKADKRIKEAEEITQMAKKIAEEASKAILKAEREAKKASKEAERETRKAEKTAREAEKTAREAEKAIQKAEKEAEKIAQEAEKIAQEAEKIAQEAEKIAQEAEKSRKKAIKKALLRGKLTIQEIAEDADVEIEFVLAMQRELEIEPL